MALCEAPAPGLCGYLYRYLVATTTMTFAGVKFALPSQLAFCGDHARGFLPPLLSIPGLRCLLGSHAQAPLFVALRRHRVSGLALATSPLHLRSI